MARLSIRLLGSLGVSRDGVPVEDFATDKVRALLAYLAAEQTHRMAGNAWPGCYGQSTPSGRPAPTCGGPSPICARPSETMAPTLHTWLPTAPPFGSTRLRTSGAIRRSSQTVSPQQRSMTSGPQWIVSRRFLEGFSVGDSPAFEEWALLQTRRA